MTTARTLHAQLHLLDRQVVRAEDGRMICKVDDLELTTDEQGRPYVLAILAGPLALGPRIGGVVGRLVVGVTELFRPEEDPGPQRIPMITVSEIGSAVTVGGDVQEAALEHWVRVNVIAPLPGSGVETAAGERRPARRGDLTGRLRMSDLIGRRVVDDSGALVGQVADVRLSQDGPMLGEVQHAFRVAGLIVVPRHTGQLFGYERGPAGQAPALVAAVVRRLHRNSRYVTWEQVDVIADDVRLAVPTAELAPLAGLHRSMSR
ncbi:hypothetical protein [Streptosporangium carneum]|uniref:PRC-barrel domain-containing protein n=1 Tax=Streptosporangium carneum TaxID=47481 RepID=A0A9W6I439_9ACTN|nr:hypothetical protein [Streptosporangium carneum]GLK10595.1 hypothetical protein GCM10017600_40010 [Streptosporangium carneum]